MTSQPSALELIDALLAIPDEQPHSFEAVHVDAIRDALQAIRHAIAGDQASIERLERRVDELHSRALDIVDFAHQRLSERNRT